MIGHPTEIERAQAWNTKGFWAMVLATP